MDTTPEEAAQVVALLQQGLSQRAVAAQLHLSQSAVSRVYRRFQETGAFNRRPRTGRHRCTSERDDRFIVSTSLRNRHLTGVDVQQELRRVRQVAVSEWTVRRRLKEANLTPKRPASGPKLTAGHRQARLQFAREHLDWSIAQWRSVLFTDECRVCLHGSDRRGRVYRRPGERFAQCCFAETVAYGGGSCMMWAGISLEGKTALVFVPGGGRGGGLTADRYITDILLGHVVPYAEFVGEDFVLMHDNARCHTARVSRQFLREKELRTMDWPALSPDLNPIEHLWDELKRRVRARNPVPASVDELKTALLEEWDGIPQETVKKLIRSMRNRLQAARCLLIEAVRAHEAMSGRRAVCADTEDEDGEADARTGGGEAPADRATLPSGASTPMSGSISSRHSVMCSSAVSVAAATMTVQPEAPKVALDDFTSQLGESDARALVDLLKLAAAGRVPDANNAVRIITDVLMETVVPLDVATYTHFTSQLGESDANNALRVITDVLMALCSAKPAVADMVIEVCVCELEEAAAGGGRTPPPPVTVDSPHPYADDTDISGVVKIPGASSLRVVFEQGCSTERRNDPLTISDATGRIVASRSGREPNDWAQELIINGDELRWRFTSDGSVNGWGWRFTAHPILPHNSVAEIGSDRYVLSRPSVELAWRLLDGPLLAAISGDHQLAPRLAQALAICAQMPTLSWRTRVWCVRRLRGVVSASSVSPAALQRLPALLHAQYELEEPALRTGSHLLHSSYLKELAWLACSLRMDARLCTGPESLRWAWFKKYCLSQRTATALTQRLPLPQPFIIEVRKRLADLGVYNPEEINVDARHAWEDNVKFTKLHDEQLLHWVNKRPEEWTNWWGGGSRACSVYGWGHNHRGQLGGVEGGKVRAPTQCAALAALSPALLVGGEQTLFAVTPDGRVYATGYGAGGRLGIGGIDSVSQPTLLSSIQHVFITKVACNSGGKHCLALSADGEVYSWGEGEDGKLGHGNRVSYDRPKLITALSGLDVVGIACGGAHSACITARGRVYTWGKGRYGRLGHGDSEDQLTPKMVEALAMYRVVDVACGSGDAQTLCITDDDNVWSWGDGDYGKLGRGGSEGCKLPMRIDCLKGMRVVKVECGSQFSVALCQCGSVYTWGKGDYHRLGHGSYEHVRRPMRVTGMQGKPIVAIATGSLHCVACTEGGEVYTWGDNDEGQLGDGTTLAAQRPRLLVALQRRRAPPAPARAPARVPPAAGGAAARLLQPSGECLILLQAQRGNKPRPGPRPPPAPPLECHLLQEAPQPAYCNRLVSVSYYCRLRGGTSRAPAPAPARVPPAAGGAAARLLQPPGECLILLQAQRGNKPRPGPRPPPALPLECHLLQEAPQPAYCNRLVSVSYYCRLRGGTSRAPAPAPARVPPAAGGAAARLLQPPGECLILLQAQRGNKPRPGPRPPPALPLECHLLQEAPQPAYCNRLVLLHHFSELVAPTLPLLSLDGPLDELRNLMFYNIKETIFRKAIMSTMVRERQHGPVVELSRVAARRARRGGAGLAGAGGMRSVFGQMVARLPHLTPDALLLPSRVWKVKLAVRSASTAQWSNYPAWRRGGGGAGLAGAGGMRSVFSQMVARLPHLTPDALLLPSRVWKVKLAAARRARRGGAGLAGAGGMRSVFSQMVARLPHLTPDALLLPSRVWKVKLAGESVDDCGGGYSESIAEMCEELQNGSLPLLLATPNGRGDAGASRDTFLLNPTANSPLHLNCFRFLGVLMGIAIRTGSPLSLSLAEGVWRQAAGQALRPQDLAEVDKDFLPALLCIRDMSPTNKVSLLLVYLLNAFLGLLMLCNPDRAICRWRPFWISFHYWNNRCLMGIAIRTGSPLSLSLAEGVWRQAAGQALRPQDLAEVDKDFLPALLCIRDMTPTNKRQAAGQALRPQDLAEVDKDFLPALLCIRDMTPTNKELQNLDLPFSIPSAAGHEVPLSTRHKRVTPENKDEYLHLALHYRSRKCAIVRDGTIIKPGKGLRRTGPASRLPNGADADAVRGRRGRGRVASAVRTEHRHVHAALRQRLFDPST
ncbi:unnamed protein product [Plutella xylostella]|uniref:(diamondback moth) hypothetical protein n=1 Tax=Plutella xylostella TaxID=51655 RepID=A0A8S4E551_PLUXY|nr:unnamed protein product [Plutella xylostella]